jgi:predicted nucleic acid-binding protein
VTRFVLDTNVFVRAIRNTEVRAELAAWQRAMASHIYQNAAVVGEILTGAACEAVRQRWHARWAAPAEPLARVRASSTIVFSRPGAGSTAARLHGCTAARLHGCTAARLHGCTAARLHGCTAARLHGCTA